MKTLLNKLMLQTLPIKIFQPIGILVFICFGRVIAQDLTNIKSIKPITINGSVGVNSIFYSASGIAERQSPFAYGINANATLAIYGISMPFSFTWYNNQKAGVSQPFNQFGISPTYKWLTVHLGYRNISFSEFTLNGHTFLGGGIEARPGKWRLGAVYGKFNQNSEYDLQMTDSIPKLTRIGWAAKVGYGTDNTFVNFSMLKIGDDSKNYVVSTNPNFPIPAQNLVTGITSKISITKELVWNFDGSMSFYTTNKMLQNTDSVNDKLLLFSGNFININPSSQRHSALKTALTYQFAPGIASGVEYRRIDPEFQSMGSYFFNNDIELVTFNQSASFLKNKITARGSLGLQQDNLNKMKKNTSKRIIGSLSGSYTIDQNFALDASYSNFSTNQKAIKNITNDSLKIFQVNHNLVVMPRFIKTTLNFSHMIMLNLNWMILDDKNHITADITNTDTKIAMLIYSLGLVKQRMNLSCGISYTNMSNKNYTNELTGLTLGISSTLLKDKLTLSWNNSLMNNNINTDRGILFNTLLNANYRFHPKHNIAFNISFINTSFANTSINPSFNEIRGDISYVFNF